MGLLQKLLRQSQPCLVPPMLGTGLLCSLHMFPNIYEEKHFPLLLISSTECHLEILTFKLLHKFSHKPILKSSLPHPLKFLDVLPFYIFTNNTATNLMQKPSSASFLAIPQTNKATNVSLPLSKNSTTPWMSHSLKTHHSTPKLIQGENSATTKEY